MNVVPMAIGLSVGTGLGVALGAAIGAAAGNVGLGTALGAPGGAWTGLSIGITFAVLRAPGHDDEHCPACGYSTTGLRSRICPECGRALDAPAGYTLPESMPAAPRSSDNDATEEI